MDPLKKALEALKTELHKVLQTLKIDEFSAQQQQLQFEMQQPDFWQNTAHAQTVSRQESKLRRRLEPWQTLARELDEALEFAALSDESMVKELQLQLDRLRAKLDQLRAELRFSGPHDDKDVIMSIHAGAGGTDAQDWAQMMLRMYARWAEKHGYDVMTIDESAGEEAGLKNITLEVTGPFAYGKLKGEHGVHRLVRLSPFNADSRETSFAKVDIMPKIDQPDALKIDDKDLRIDVYRSGGHGGQSVNTTDSAVRLTHLPTGITVAIQNERSQLQNKETALTILRSKLAALQIEQHKEALSELKGPNQSAEWGNQIRTYVLHPYKQVKDLRTRYETSDIESVLDGGLDPLIEAYLDLTLGDDKT